MKKPLVAFTFIFCLGIFFENALKIPFLFVYLASVLFLIFVFFIPRNSPVAKLLFFALAFFLGAACLQDYWNLPKCHISSYAYYKNDNLYALKGFITGEPAAKINRTAFIFQAEELYFNRHRTSVCGNTLVHMKAGKDLHYGDALIISGTLGKPFNKSVQGKTSYKDYLANQGIYSVIKASRVMKLNYNKGHVFRRLALFLKEKIEAVIFKYMDGTAAGIVDAMILGEKEFVPPLVYQSMIRTGTVHILVVSGFNVGIVFLVISLSLRLLRLPRRMRILIALPLLLLYCLVTGASNPVVRATVMAVIYLLAYFFKRDADIYNSLALAALFILVVNPRQLFDVGFQLSFASVFSIVYLNPKLKSVLNPDKLRLRFMKFVLEGFLVSLSAWLGTAALIAYYFRFFSPVTVLANMLIVPLATLINLCGCSFVLIALFCPALGRLFALSCQLLAALLVSVNNLLLIIPGAYWRLG